MHRWYALIFVADWDSPNNEGDAQGPGGRKVWVFKNGRVLCEGVVVDDGRLLVLERFTQEPLLVREECEQRQKKFLLLTCDISKNETILWWQQILQQLRAQTTKVERGFVHLGETRVCWECQ